MGIDEAAMSWQRDYMARGDLLGWTPDEAMIRELAEMSKETQRELVEAISNGVSQGIGRLMEVK